MCVNNTQHTYAFCLTLADVLFMGVGERVEMAGENGGNRNLLAWILGDVVREQSEPSANLGCFSLTGELP
jgi:hypothetical protein